MKVSHGIRDNRFLYQLDQEAILEVGEAILEVGLGSNQVLGHWGLGSASFPKLTGCDYTPRNGL